MLREEMNASSLLAEMNASKQSSLHTALGLMRDETEGAGKTVKERTRRGGSNPKPGVDHTPPDSHPSTCIGTHADASRQQRMCLAASVTLCACAPRGSAVEARHAQERAYLRALILRYLEMESQHEACLFRRPHANTPPLAPARRHRPACPEHGPCLRPGQALFPAIATYFKFTEEEVARLARKQEEHAS